MKEQTIGAQARLMSKALRKLTASLNKNKTTIIFINQIREKIGILFGNPEVTPGGKALKFYSSIRLEIRRAQKISSNNEISGNQVKIKVVKNKLAPPYKQILTEIIFAKGISKESELIDLALIRKIIERKGAWFSFEGKNLAQGKNNLKKMLEKDRVLYDKFFKLAITDFK